MTVPIFAPLRLVTFCVLSLRGTLMMINCPTTAVNFWNVFSTHDSSHCVTNSWLIQNISNFLLLLCDNELSTFLSWLFNSSLTLFNLASFWSRRARSLLSRHLAREPSTLSISLWVFWIFSMVLKFSIFNFRLSSVWSLPLLPALGFLKRPLLRSSPEMNQV